MSPAVFGKSGSGAAAGQGRGDLDTQQSRLDGIDRQSRAVIECHEQSLAGQRQLIDLVELDVEWRLAEEQQSLARQIQAAREIVDAIATQVAADDGGRADRDDGLAWSDRVGDGGVGLDRRKPFGSVQGSRVEGRPLILTRPLEDGLSVADPGPPVYSDRERVIHGGIVEQSQGAVV